MPTPSAPSGDMTLDQVIERLSGHPEVDGVLVIGSAARAALLPASDYDLVVVLRSMPVPLHVGLTFIDHRMTDLIFVTVDQIEEVIGTTTLIDGGQWIGRTVRWLLAGVIWYDRDGRLLVAQQNVRNNSRLQPLHTNDAYGAWFQINYNFAQTRRLLASDDALYRTTGEVRMALYGLPDTLFGYFPLRVLRWEGEKAALRYLEQYDQAFFALVQRFLATTERVSKFDVYEQLAAHAVAPLGPLWADEVTAFAFDASSVPSHMIEQGLAFWEHLVS